MAPKGAIFLLMGFVGFFLLGIIEMIKNLNNALSVFLRLFDKKIIVKVMVIFCFSTAHAKQIVTKPIVSYATNYSGTGVVSPSIEELVKVVNESLAKSNALCISGWCSDALFSTTAVSRGGPLVNGLPGYYDVGENMGKQWNTQTGEVYNAHVLPLWVKADQVCKWPFQVVYSADSQTMSCVFNEPESNACGAGNPVNIATGVKYEQEVDYTSADGVLKVERFYLNQNIGWVVDYPLTLNVLPAGSTIELPEYSYKQVQEFTKSIVETPVSYYLQIYQPPLFNPSTNRESYIWHGRKMLHFMDIGSGFFPDNIDSLTSSIVELNSVDFPNAKWRLILDNQDTHYFSAGGTVLRSEFSNGGVVNYEYTDGRLSAKTDQKGRRLAYAYDADDRLTTITQPDGNTITYTYGADKNAIDFNFLTKVTWSNGESISYLYNEPLNITGINPGTVALTGKLDTNGQRIGNYKYNGPHAISTERYMGIEKKQLTFSSSTTVTDALNAPRTYHFYQPKDGQRFLNGTSQPAGSGCAATTKYTEYYLETDLKKSEADFNGNKQQFAYDTARKLETIRVEGIPKSDSIDYLPQGKTLASGIRKISTQWHSQWRSPVKKAEPKILTTYIYNGDADPFNGNQVANCSNFTSIPLLCRQVQQATADTNGQSGLSAVLDTTIPKHEWFYTYNNRDQLLSSSRNATGTPDELREYYETSSSDWRIGDLKSITNKLGHQTRFTKYDANGRVLTMQDVNSVTTQFTYDIRGRLTSQSVAGNTTAHTYDLNGNRIASVLPNGVTVNYYYDAAKRLTAIENALGDKINYEYDLESNLRFERITNPNGTITYLKEHIYDALSREKNLVNSLNQSRTHLYDANGNSTGEIDAKQQTTNHSFDALDQLKLTTDALAGKTEFSYNAQGHITAVKDPKNHSTTYAYNAFGELTQQTSPDTGITTFTYDALGNRTSATDARGVVVNYSYDAINRLTLVDYPASPTENVAYTYDGTANGSYGVGRLTSVMNGGVSVSYSYNHLGLISQKRTASIGINGLTAYGYDTSGNLTSITYPSGRIVSYVRDTAGRLESIKTKASALATEQNVISSIAYMPFGPAKSYTFGNGLTHAVSFDADYRITAIEVGGVLARNYEYDNVDNITNIADGLATSKTQTFTYDPLNRLTSANGGYGYQAFSYDAVGNRTGFLFDNGSTILSDTYNYATNSNRLSSIDKTAGGLASGVRTFTYDAAGNRIQGTGEDNKPLMFNYNNANRLSSSKAWGVLAGTYAYNALGQRVSKTYRDNTKELFHYDEAGQLIAVTNATGVVQREYIYNGNQLVGFVSGGSLNFVHSDHLTTPQVVTNQSQAVVWVADYQPFGEAKLGVLNSISLDSRFPGQSLDSETGLYYNYFRDYDPSIGRYIESDPIGLGGGINTYAYVEGNPIRNVDIYGLQAIIRLPPLIPVPGFTDTGPNNSYNQQNPNSPYDVPYPTGDHSWWENKDSSQYKDYKAYKDAYNQPEPPNLDECEKAKLKLEKEKNLLRDRKFWDETYAPGTHSPATYLQSENAIKNFEKKVEKACKKECP